MTQHYWKARRETSAKSNLHFGNKSEANFSSRCHCRPHIISINQNCQLLEVFSDSYVLILVRLCSTGAKRYQTECQDVLLGEAAIVKQSCLTVIHYVRFHNTILHEILDLLPFSLQLHTFINVRSPLKCVSDCSFLFYESKALSS